MPPLSNPSAKITEPAAALVSPAALARRQAGVFAEEPFRPGAVWTRTAVVPDIIVPLDLDLDGRADVAVLGRDDHRLLTLAGNGSGEFDHEAVDDLGGAVTAAAGGQVGRRDDLPDLAVAVIGSAGPRLVILEGAPRTGFARRSEGELPRAAEQVLIGLVDDDPLGDIALKGASGSWMVARGSDSPLGGRPFAAAELVVEELPDGPRRAEVAALAGPGGEVAAVALSLDPDGQADTVALVRDERGPLVVKGSTPPAITVNVTDDTSDGTCDVAHCSLREAIAAANASPAPTQIVFAIPGPPPLTIAVSGTALPTITNVVTVDGTTQPGYAGSPVVVLDGTGLPSGHGLDFMPGNGSSVRGLTIAGFPGAGIHSGVALEVKGCYIGTDVTGTQAHGNGSGVVYDGFGYQAVVGGFAPGEGNLIAANPGGAIVTPTNGAGGTGCTIAGNRIGTDVTGTVALGGGGVTVGIVYEFNFWGEVAGNLIAGTDANALLLVATNASVTGNWIGVDSSGAVALANVAGVTGLSFFGNIGGVAPGSTNVISGNLGPGVQLSNFVGLPNSVRGNLIGLAAGGAAILGNGGAGVTVSSTQGTTLIQGNAIAGNGDLGIDLAADGVTANDPGDADSGANELQNFPLLTAAEIGAGTLRVVGTLDSVAAQSFTVEVAASAACDPSGQGEGEIPLGTFSVTTDGSGHAAIDQTLTAAVVEGAAITATATRTASGTTSEYSPCVVAAVTSGLFADGFESGDSLAWSSTVP